MVLSSLNVLLELGISVEKEEEIVDCSVLVLVSRVLVLVRFVDKPEEEDKEEDGVTVITVGEG